MDLEQGSDTGPCVSADAGPGQVWFFFVVFVDDGDVFVLDFF